MDKFWEKPNWQSEDLHLSALKRAPFQRPFPTLPNGTGLFVIRGPRQIGKSSWLKQILAGENPKNVFYLSCDNLKDHLDLAEVFKSTQSYKVILLDEVSFISEWWRAVKHELDRRSDLRLIVTGSHAFELRKGMDLMPGRWKNGGDFELLPMEYSEFSSMRRQAKWPTLDKKSELELYFRVGGFPLALIESGAEGKKPEKAFEIYRRWLLGDLTKIGKQEVFLKELLAQIAITTCSTLSLQKLAQKTQMGSHNTAQDYVEVLESCFALKTLYAVDQDTGAPRFRKEKKFYFRDPLIYWLAFEWAGIEAPANAYDQVAEQVAHEHLLRRYKRFGYFSSRGGEIDFYSAKKWALEVKWKAFADGLSKTFKDLKNPQKIVWTQNNFLEEWPEGR